MSIVGYYYLHQNGSLIYKPYDEGRIADFRESDFVRAFWPLDPEDRETAWRCLVEAKALGASDTRIAELAELWHCDDGDAPRFAERVGLQLKRDGNAWCATRTDFVNLQDSPSGFGGTCLNAMSRLAVELGYQAQKTWGASFQDLVRT